jgi:RNA polymerase sigma-70 factor (ECF subfamily)
MNRPSDVDLLARVRNGDAQAFAGLVHEHGRYLFGVARALVRDEQEAEDIVQETFAAVLISPYRGESALRTWLVGIVVRQAALARRRGWWRRFWPLHAPDERPATQPDPQRAIDARLDLAQLLDQLTPEHREVIVLRELEGMSYEQIAAMLKLPRGTVESRLHRARQQLRDALEDQP